MILKINRGGNLKKENVNKNGWGGAVKMCTVEEYL